MHDISGERVDWNAIRQDFPILRERAHGHQLIYFDNAATSQKPQLVIDTLRNYYEHNNANVHRGLHELSSRATELYEKARERVAAYIGATSADQIIFTRGTTESINLVAQSWGGKFISQSDVILLKKWSTTAISSPGSCLRNERAHGCVLSLSVKMALSHSIDSIPCSRRK